LIFFCEEYPILPVAFTNNATSEKEKNKQKSSDVVKMSRNEKHKRRGAVYFQTDGRRR
jgi:hypothetical protein